jgi:hypothetical protein
MLPHWVAALPTICGTRHQAQIVGKAVAAKAATGALQKKKSAAARRSGRASRAPADRPRAGPMLSILVGIDVSSKQA